MSMCWLGRFSARRSLQFPECIFSPVLSCLVQRMPSFRRVERQYGSFTRSFTLPSSVDLEKVSAHYDKGVLKINLAKKAEGKPKQIKVNVGSEKTLEAKVHGKAA